MPPTHSPLFPLPSAPCTLYPRPREFPFALPERCTLCVSSHNPDTHPYPLPMTAAESSVTLVCTDVEGSTEMWEWDNKAMMDAISLHDRVMRMHLPKFGGYEVATEGDAFVIAFHTPGKAVGWAAATQQVTDW